MRTLLRTTKAGALWLILFSLTVATASATDCVPNGETTTLTFNRPDIQGNGMPVDAKYTGVPPAVMEDDVSHDDYMGPGTPSRDGSTATVELENDNGSIEGPNGEDVEPGDSCVEVQMAWQYRYSVTVVECVSQERLMEITGGAVTVGSSEGTSTCISVTIHRYAWRHAPVQEVCPC